MWDSVLITYLTPPHFSLAKSIICSNWVIHCAVSMNTAPWLVSTMDGSQPRMPGKEYTWGVICSISMSGELMDFT